MTTFFLIMRRPPRSYLFPYPTLSRSMVAMLRSCGVADRAAASATAGACSVISRRSEEHTSELQSPYVITYDDFFFNYAATTEILSLSLPDALPIYGDHVAELRRSGQGCGFSHCWRMLGDQP